MTPESIALIKDISGIGALIILIITMTPVFKALGRLIEAKINHNIPYDVQKGVKNIETNHLTDIQKTLERIEGKLEKLDDIKDILVEVKTLIVK